MGQTDSSERLSEQLVIEETTDAILRLLKVLANDSEGMYRSTSIETAQSLINKLAGCNDVTNDTIQHYIDQFSLYYGKSRLIKNPRQA